MADISYDPRCEELARAILTDQIVDFHDDDVAELAGQIQQAIEDWLEVS